MANIILFVLKNNLAELALPFPKSDTENEAGIINLPMSLNSMWQNQDQ